MQNNQFKDVDGKRYAESKLYEPKLKAIVELIEQTTNIDDLIISRNDIKNTIEQTQNTVIELNKALAYKQLAGEKNEWF